MISAETIKGVQELLEQRGIEPRQGERMGDYVARGLGITGAQAETLLAALHDGATVGEAALQAGLDTTTLDPDLLTRLAKAIGSAAGRISASL